MYVYRDDLLFKYPSILDHFKQVYVYINAAFTFIKTGVESQDWNIIYKRLLRIKSISIFKSLNSN